MKRKPKSPCYTCVHRQQVEGEEYSDYTVYQCRAPLPEKIRLPAYMWQATLEIDRARAQHAEGGHMSPSSVNACDLHEPVGMTNSAARTAARL